MKSGEMSAAAKIASLQCGVAAEARRETRKIRHQPILKKRRTGEEMAEAKKRRISVASGNWRNGGVITQPAKISKLKKPA